MSTSDISLCMKYLAIVFFMPNIFKNLCLYICISFIFYISLHDPLEIQLICLALWNNTWGYWGREGESWTFRVIHQINLVSVNIEDKWYLWWRMWGGRSCIRPCMSCLQACEETGSCYKELCTDRSSHSSSTHTISHSLRLSWLEDCWEWPVCPVLLGINVNWKYFCPVKMIKYSWTVNVAWCKVETHYQSKVVVF